MKSVKLLINNNDKLRFNLGINLDSIHIKIERKNAASEWIMDYSEIHLVNKETDIHALLEKAYDKFLEQKDIESFWLSNFEGTTVVEIKEKEPEPEKKS